MAENNYTGNVYGADVGRQDGYPDARPDAYNGHTGAGGPSPERSQIGGAVSVLGAMASLALMAGVGIWGYKLMVRDVSGVPVVRALAGPMRVQPDDPGGQQADHQGLAVNAVAALGAAAPTADRLMLAPRAVELTDEDVPLSQISTQPEPLVAPNSGPNSGLDAGQVIGDAVVTEAALRTRPDAGEAQAEGQAMDVNALVEQLTAGVAPLSNPASPVIVAVQDPAAPKPDTSEEVAAAGGQASDAAIDAIVLSGPGLARSLRPQARPARAVISGDGEPLDPIMASAINSAVEAVARLDADPNSLPAGTRLAQLGAYDSIEIAHAEWDRMNVRFEEYMDGKKRVIQKATSGGRTFYRLRAMGFADLSEARRFCSALVAENADCIPVTSR